MLHNVARYCNILQDVARLDAHKIVIHGVLIVAPLTAQAVARAPSNSLTFF